MVDKGLILASPWDWSFAGMKHLLKKRNSWWWYLPLCEARNSVLLRTWSPAAAIQQLPLWICWDLPGRPWLRRRHSTSSWPQIAKDSTSERFKLEKHERCRRKTSAGRAWYLLQLGTRDPTPAAKLSVYHSRADWAVDLRSNLLRLPVKVGNCHEYLRHP